MAKLKNFASSARTDTLWPHEALYRLSPRLKVPEGETYGRIEAPKGELGFYLVSKGGPNPYRYHVRSPSLINLTTLSELCRDSKIADVVTILGSIDLTMGEVDR